MATPFDFEKAAKALEVLGHELENLGMTYAL